ERIGDLEAVLEAQIARAPAPAVKLRRPRGFTRKIKCDSRKSLYGEGKQREFVVERELYSIRNAVDEAAAIMPRVTGARLLDHRRRKDRDSAESKLRDVAINSVAAADKAVKRSGLRVVIVHEREPREETVFRRNRMIHTHVKLVCRRRAGNLAEEIS